MNHHLSAALAQTRAADLQRRRRQESSTICSLTAHPRATPIRATTLLLALTLIMLSGLVGMASAAVPGLQRVVAPSVTDSSDHKSATAWCPVGKRLIGAGGDIDNGVGDVVMDDLIPNAALTAVTVKGYEDDNGAPTTWRANAYAICANPIPGLQRVVAPSVTDSSDHKSATAWCPVGKRLIGAGGDIDNGVGDVVMDDLIPNAALTAVTVKGYEDDNGAPTTWRANAYAICANPIPGLQRVVAPSVTDSSDHKSATAWCPVGKRLIGAGGDIDNGVGDVVMDDLIPNAALTAVTVKGYEDDNGAPTTWRANAYAICAN